MAWLRQNARKRAAKREKLEAEVDAALKSVRVKRVDSGKLRNLSLEAKAEWYEFCGKDDSDPRTAPDEVILRWMVNFIRHNLTRYDTKLDLWKGKTGISAEYPRFRNGVLAKIAELYADAPEIAEECRRQMI